MQGHCWSVSGPARDARCSVSATQQGCHKEQLQRQLQQLNSRHASAQVQKAVKRIHPVQMVKMMMAATERSQRRWNQIDIRACDLYHRSLHEPEQ